MAHAEEDIYLRTTVFDDTDEIVPQANSIEKVVLSVDAVAGGCLTSQEIAEALDVDPRQGAYYATAARHLGLVERAEHGEWALTDGGEEAAEATNEELMKLLNSKLAENRYIAIYVDGGEEALVKEWSARGDIGPETIRRRTSTISAWAEYWTADDETKLARLSACRKEIGDRCATIRARPHPILARRTVPAPQHGRCRACGIQLPFANTSGVCEDCPETA